jgi:hypothetical protein
VQRGAQGASYVQLAEDGHIYYAQVPDGALSQYTEWRAAKDELAAAEQARHAVAGEIKTKLLAGAESTDQLERSACCALLERMKDPVNVFSVADDLAADRHFVPTKKLTPSEKQMASKFEKLDKELRALVLKQDELEPGSDQQSAVAGVPCATLHTGLL